MRKMKILKSLLVLTLLSWVSTTGVSAYVPPLEKILGEVRKHFDSFHALVIEQAIHVISSREPLVETVYRQTAYLKIPHFDKTIPSTGPEFERGDFTENSAQPVLWQNTDAAFRWVLMSQPKGGLRDFLTRLGIQVWEVAYDRCDGIVSYRLGRKDSRSPKILIDKERCFPLLLSYVPPEDSQNRLVTVRFRDYRQHGSGWYPHVITYTPHQGDEAEYHLLDLKVNTPIDAAFFLESPTDPPVSPGTGNSDQNTDGARMDSIMRKLKEKYR